ncbi:beta-lactamase [Acetobacter nitrogenifigens DSM 23921 = NBRC 105050]|uniref:Esterase n=1 Tax=Acetobacter nitrogenifigens DSM 23921 = NBRC 105050 TaxID=1120919 RepID=A0A511XAZ0_9PROT|nr:serine hydrolase domain-containing protein [Acetobacter nitrogenifigens]GBQ92793.1 beta-lactamase [Acetobacter nitrogenifigens DSM 23921 = NBRC 105050]GEN60133.1 esterase [Acetobacter nitrogenifigens DSM 23921 = NBRC 105050]
MERAVNQERRLALRTVGLLTSGALLAGCVSRVRETPLFAPEPSFAAADAAVRDAIATGACPGAVLAVGRSGRIVHSAVFGRRAVTPVAELMTWDTVFDMASLTKPMITALAVMQLVEQGRLDVDQPLARYLPDFAANRKAAITLRLLLTHYSGLPPDLALDRPWSGRAQAWRRVVAATPIHPPGETFVYSDINFIALGFLVERISGRTLPDYAATHILTPLGMKDSAFLPGASTRARVAPTQFDEHGVMLRGVVHDPTARRMGGYAGHAGLFSTATDVATYATALLDRRAGRDSRFPLARATLLMMTTPQQPAGRAEQRGFGWDISSHYATARGERFSQESFGHTGFTGTSLWVDPKNDCFVTLLTNRVHPDGHGGVVRLRKDVATAVARALSI